ncbi:MAG: hypothetical protein PWQ44_827 [Methanolobus sp.]|nr:hypothetical protein [Methanolobus sp.]
MRTTETVIQQTFGNVELGELSDINNQITPVSLNQLLPYISGDEDIEIILKNPDLVTGTPLEMNGYKTKNMLSKASKIEMESGLVNQLYSPLMNSSPSLMSFPSEVTWLSIPDGIEKFQQNASWIMQKDNIGFNLKKALSLSEYLGMLMQDSYQKYSFWTSLTNKYDNEHLFRLLIDITIELALQSKMTYLAGMTPILNQKSPNSVDLAHNVNLGYGSIIADREDEGYNAPGYYYTINLNASMIKRDDFSDELKKLVFLTKEALNFNWFDGIYLSVRDLERISQDGGRVATLSKLIEQLAIVAHNEKIPLWLSRFGLIGLPAFDMGACFASYTTNLALRDIFTKSKGGSTRDRRMHGKVLNPDVRKIWDANQIDNTQRLKHSLPSINGVRNYATKDELQSSQAKMYRTHFSKPYNIASMHDLSQKWCDDIKNGEVNPGKEYIKSFTSPSFYSTWGCA